MPSLVGSEMCIRDRCGQHPDYDRKLAKEGMQLLPRLILAPVNQNADERIIKCIPNSGDTRYFANVIGVHMQHVRAEIKDPLVDDPIGCILSSQCRRVRQQLPVWHIALVRLLAEEKTQRV